MLSAGEISKLMWQCAYVYACRQEAGLSQSEVRVLRAMRYYFRAGERPPQSLATRAMGIVSMYKANQQGLTRRLKIVSKRKARRIRLESAEGRRGKNLPITPFLEPRLY